MNPIDYIVWCLNQSPESMGMPKWGTFIVFCVIPYFIALGIANKGEDWFDFEKTEREKSTFDDFLIEEDDDD